MIHIHPYERWWIVLSATVMGIFVLALGLSAFVFGFQTPYSAITVNPNTITQTAPFSEPGLRQLAPGKYEAYVVAQATPGWLWQPTSMRVPVGSEVTFYITSKDVQHGFLLQNTNVNVMALPGRVAKVTHVFTQPGEYHYVCHEYCGLGHGYMFGTITVE